MHKCWFLVNTEPFLCNIRISRHVEEEEVAILLGFPSLTPGGDRTTAPLVEMVIINEWPHKTNAQTPIAFVSTQCVPKKRTLRD